MRYVGYLLLFLLITSCGKERMLKVSAVNPVTGEGYAGLPFAVISQTSGTFESNYKKEYEGTLDNNGQASFAFKLKKRPFYILRIQVPENNCYIKTHEYTFDVTTTNFNFPFEFAPCAYLKFRYYNSDCKGEEDRIEVERYTLLENYTGFIINAVYDGCTDYTMPDFVEVPMGWWYFKWKVEKDGIIENFKDSIYLSKGEYKNYEFIY